MIYKIQNTNDWLDYVDVFLDPILLIITFFLGYLISNWQVKRNEKRDLDEQFAFFTLYLTKQRDSIKKQIDAIKETVTELENLKPFNPAQTKFIIQPIELLNTLNKAHVTKSFENKGYPPNDEVTLFMFINLCIENFNNFRESHFRFSKRQNDLLFKWNDLIQDFHKSKMRSTNIPKNDLINSPELMKLNKYYNDLCDIEPAFGTPEKVIDVCIKPLNDYFLKVNEQDHTNIYSIEYIPKLEQIGIIYAHSEEYIKQQKDYLLSILNVLNDQIKKSNIDKYCI
jgi:hypothetical protein